MLLSIIVPTLNEESILERTLKELHDNLTDFEHEIIVTDDGSTDRTIEIAKKYAKVFMDPSPHRTIATNRNNGARMAKGDYFVFVDADMFIPEPNRFFRTLLGDFAADPKLVGVTVKINVLPNEARFWDRVILWITNIVQHVNNDILHKGSASGEFQMIKASAFHEIKGYQEHLAVAEDNDLFYRLAKIGNTHIDMRLNAYNSGRRPHTMGWPKVLWLWAINLYYVRTKNRSYNKKWSEVR